MPHTCFLDNLDLLALHEAHPERYPFLLESVARGGDARYDILFALPGETLSSAADGDFLAELDVAWQHESAPVADDANIPFRGGWFLYLGYELAAQIEPFDSFWAGPQDIEKAYTRLYAFYPHNYVKHFPADRQARLLLTSCRPRHILHPLHRARYQHLFGLDSEALGFRRNGQVKSLLDGQSARVVSEILNHAKA